MPLCFLQLTLDCEVSGRIARAQPSVGIMSPYCPEPSIDTITINGRQLPEAVAHLLERFLLSDDDIRGEVEDAVMEGAE